MAKRPRTDPFRRGMPWDAWRDQLLSAHHMIGGLGVLEQLMKRSQAEARCVECGEAGTVRFDRTAHSLIKAVDHYWMCQECADYWKARQEAERPASRRRTRAAVAEQGG